MVNINRNIIALCDQWFDYTIMFVDPATRDKQTAVILLKVSPLVRNVWLHQIKCYSDFDVGPERSHEHHHLFGRRHHFGCRC